MAYTYLSHKIKESLNVCMAVLREDFKLPSKRKYYILEFEWRKRQDWELGRLLVSLADKNSKRENILCTLPRVTADVAGSKAA